RAGFEVAKWVGFCHPTTLGDHPARLKLVSSDSAVAKVGTRINPVCQARRSKTVHGWKTVILHRKSR
ncbi:MAG: hypothetical protein ABJ074_00015, partial [Paracoccaceae bacterium]